MHKDIKKIPLGEIFRIDFPSHSVTYISPLSWLIAIPFGSLNDEFAPIPSIVLLLPFPANVVMFPIYWSYHIASCCLNKMKIQTLHCDLFNCVTGIISQEEYFLFVIENNVIRIEPCTLCFSFFSKSGDQSCTITLINEYISGYLFARSLRDFFYRFQDWKEY